jgi:hypothetical protein
VNEKIVEKFLDSPGSALHILGSSFEQFIRFFHWYIYHQEFIFKPFHVEIIQKLEDIVSSEQFNMSTVAGGGPLASAAKEACRKRMQKALQKKARVESRGTWLNEMLSKYK